MRTELEKSELIRVRKPDAERAIAVMAEAFSEYGMMKYYFPDVVKRRQMTRYYLAVAVYYGIRYGEVYASSDAFEGAAVWIPSGNFPLKPGRIFRSVPLGIVFNLARNGHRGTQSADAYIDSVHQRLVPYRHLYLQSIGVASAHQGKGFSGKLIRPILERCDAEGLPCFLETLDEKNASLYEHFGFSVIDKSHIPGTELVNRAMLREARK